MPFVNIRIVKEVIASDPEGKKPAIAEKVTNAIAESTGLAKGDVWVVFEEVAARLVRRGGQRRKPSQSEMIVQSGVGAVLPAAAPAFVPLAALGGKSFLPRRSQSRTREAQGGVP